MNHIVPVLDSELVIHLDQGNHVYLVSGRYVPTPSDLDVTPALSAEQALEIAAAHVGVPRDGCDACEAQLVVYPSPEGHSALAYVFNIRLSLVKAWQVVIDAHSGELLRQTSRVYQHN